MSNQSLNSNDDFWVVAVTDELGHSDESGQYCDSLCLVCREDAAD